MTILVTGSDGFVGKHLTNYLHDSGFDRVYATSRDICDLTDRSATVELFEEVKPDYVFHLAGRVRGLGGNLGAQGASYLENTLINTHVIDAAHLSGVKKIIAMGTVAMYPDPLPHNPLRESDLWMGKPHDSEFGYAQAKRGMAAQLEAYHHNYGTRYVLALSTNLYGPHDRFNVATGHVIPSLIAKFHNSGKISVWGDGSAQRDFLYVKDCVRALVLFMTEQVEGLINLASGKTYCIMDVVNVLDECTGNSRNIVYDDDKPNGQLVRSYDVSHLNELGFKTEFSLEDGLTETYKWYSANVSNVRR